MDFPQCSAKRRYLLLKKRLTYDHDLNNNHDCSYHTRRGSCPSARTRCLYQLSSPFSRSHHSPCALSLEMLLSSRDPSPSLRVSASGLLPSPQRMGLQNSPPSGYPVLRFPRSPLDSSRSPPAPFLAPASFGLSLRSAEPTIFASFIFFLRPRFFFCPTPPSPDLPHPP